MHTPGLPPPDADRSPYLAATGFLDIRHPLVTGFVAAAGATAGTARERAVALFYAVRDRIRYQPYGIGFEPDAYRASAVIRAGHGWCVPKAQVVADFRVHYPGIVARAGAALSPDGAPDAFERRD